MEEERQKTLLHQRADGKPEAVGERELVVHDVRLNVAAVFAAPLVRREARDDEQHQADEQVAAEHRQPDLEQHQADEQVAAEHRQPDLERQRRQEREEAGRLVGRPLEQDADAEVHERLGEVDDFLAHVADRQRRDGQVRLLSPHKPRTKALFTAESCGGTGKGARLVAVVKVVL